jgi:hypothetical protein
VQLSGTIAAEHRFGPPGYGEDPKRDEKRVIFVLKLREPVNVCADTSKVSPAPVARLVKVVQLERMDAGVLRRGVGVSVEVFGTLRRNVWPSDYTTAVINIDSIPAFRPRSQRGD